MDTSERLWALEEVKRLKALYFRLMDEKRWEEWGNLFTEDATFTIAAKGEVETVNRGRREIVDVLSQVMVGLCIHQGHMPEIDIVDEHNAHALWTYQYYGHLGPEQLVKIYGIYNDDYVKESNGEWRIKRLTLDRLQMDEL